MCLLAANSAVCQTPEKLSLKKAVATALSNPIRIKETEARLLTARGDVTVAKVISRSSVGSAIGYQKDPSESEATGRIFGNYSYDGFSGASGNLRISPVTSGRNNASTSLQARLPLQKGSGRLSEKSVQLYRAEKRYSVREKEVFLEKQSLTLDVIESYISAVLAREEIIVAEKALEIARKVAHGTKRRVEVGRLAGIELSRANIRLSQVEERLNERRENAKAALDRLMLLINAGVGSEPELTDDIPSDTKDDILLFEAVRTALENRRELNVTDTEMDIQMRLLERAEDQLGNALDAVAGYSSYSSDGLFSSSSIFDDSYWNVGLEYSISLDKQIENERVDELTRNISLAEDARLYQMENIAGEVRRAYRDLQLARANHENLLQRKTVAQDNLRIAERMLEEGISDNRNVLDAQEALTEADNGLLRAKSQIYLARTRLDYAMGVDLAEKVVR